MKVCSNCGIEIDTVDGDNFCPECDGDVPSGQSEPSPSPPKQLKRKTLSRADREEIYRDLGLVKVRGRLGGTYFE